MPLKRSCRPPGTTAKQRGGRSGLAPAAENQTAEREAETEGPDSEGADRGGLPPRGEALPAAEGLLLLVRQRLAAALLAHGAAGAQAEIEIIEDLGRFVGHITQCTSLFRRCQRGSSTSPTCMSAPLRSRMSNALWRR